MRHGTYLSCRVYGHRQDRCCKGSCKKLKVNFIDLDSYIEKKEGLTINEIFKSRGEAYFRRLEKKALRDASRKNTAVISCGGGIVIDPDNIAFMKARGKCVCLTASPQEILRRIGTTKNRPLLQGPCTLKKIQRLLSCRDAAYRKADILIDTTGLDVNKVVALIIKKVITSRQAAQ